MPKIYCAAIANRSPKAGILMPAFYFSSLSSNTNCSNIRIISVWRSCGSFLIKLRLEKIDSRIRTSRASISEDTRTLVVILSPSAMRSIVRMVGLPLPYSISRRLDELIPISFASSSWDRFFRILSSFKFFSYDFVQIHISKYLQIHNISLEGFFSKSNATKTVLFWQYNIHRHHSAIPYIFSFSWHKMRA